ncbi:hypothetical protein DL764_010069 [Monosporascus ibericus]|uniref:DNA replication regulator SLD2 n=1 Tax=Monosporascus ibericus TaxID=155417 RepID=A0A4Q4STF0_9PEZI|nr:hypothetical protein DL764_010069 [Monosporascus ibericus]
MDENERRNYEATAQELRTELKRFEGDWAKQNDGRKPGREDIKQNPDIAKKYKQYSRVRDILAGKVEPPKAEEPSRSRKRTSEEAAVQTPSKRHRSIETPSKLRQYDVDEVSFETPSSRKLFSPTVPTSIGPTPQKDGRVLGLFDLLVENDENTPSRPRTGEAEDANVQATPSRRAVADDVDELEAIKMGRTPMSTSKRTMLNTFMTPLKLRDGNSAGAKTPTSVSKLQFSTPSFLRRAPLPAIDENEGYKSPRPLRLPRKPLGRSLSSIVATLRKVEEETLDDDLEALHEMENDAPAPKSSRPAKPSNDDVLVQDSRAPQLLGGFDDESLYDSPTEEALGRDGQPLRVYKKKGQKRTTRRVNMRPTRTKRPQQSVEEEEDDDEDTVPETQFDASKPDNEEPLDIGSDSDFDESERGDREDAQKKEPKKGSTKEPKGEGRLKKTVRKVNAMAHANFKRLKLKNHGAKGGPGFNSKFRRRR